MVEKIQSIRGMNDILPDATPTWRFVEGTMQSVLTSYGYKEIRFPDLEKTDLFVRSIGETTDIVTKEMYTFDDRNGDSLTLRPEGTASCVRASMQHGLINTQQKLWYSGPMFRHERPQKGRYRQFHQIGVEVFGLTGPDIDAEILCMCARMWAALGIGEVELQINSLGTAESRQTYRDILVEYFSDHSEKLDEDSKTRLYKNPLRILDSKNPELEEAISKAPELFDYLDTESREHFLQLQELLTIAGLAFQINTRLVRGLDYYGRTVFEWVTDKLGAQNAVCSGGRYDGLVEHFGGKPTPAIGFGAGLERLIELVQVAGNSPTEQPTDVYFIIVGKEATLMGLKLAEQLRTQIPSMNLLVNAGGGSFKSQFKKADKSGASLALVMGEDECKAKEVGVKYLREEKAQQAFKLDELENFLKQELNT